VNRTYRLHAMTAELRRAGPRGRTSQRLAEQFAVSTRTVKRDVAALQQAGLPICAEPGPGGGYILDDAQAVPPVTFTAAQAVAVAVALATLRQAPSAPDCAGALAKVLDVLDAESRERAGELAERVWSRTGPTTPAASASVLDEALRRRLVVVLDYVDAEGQQSRRPVEPMLLAQANGNWYFVGWCRQRDAVRWFRCDRVAAATLTAEHAPDRKLAVLADQSAEAPAGR
jgi:predicted DNA-binding transcriptional regulator YafY